MSQIYGASSAANTKFMKVNYNPQSSFGSSERASKLLLALWSVVQTHEVRRISQREICRYLGISPGTWINWTTDSDLLHQVEALLQLLERIPEEVRYPVLERFMRVRPVINSSRLAHDPLAISQLLDLLVKPTGLTFIQGSNDAARTFVFNAWAHAFSQRLSFRPNQLSGIDVHPLDWLVPVDGIHYLTTPWPGDRASAEINKTWPLVGKGQCRMFNGLWRRLPERHAEMHSWARNCHVVIADETNYSPAQLRVLTGKLKFPVRLISLSQATSDQIQLKFQLI
jgi:hypothetical protein